MMRGKYIILEGGEGVGKTTQAKMLVKSLRMLNIEAVHMIEPGSAPFAQELRKVIKQGPERSPKANLFAFSAARAESLEEVRKLQSKGTWVIADRSWISTIVYQGHVEGLPLNEVRTICEIAVGSAKPDKVLILDADPETIVNRVESRSSDKKDYYDNRGRKFHKQVQAGYLKEAKRLNAMLIDANQSIQNTYEDIWAQVIKIVPKELLVAMNPEKPKQDSRELSEGALIQKNKNGSFSITKAGKRYLHDAVTNTEDDVYVFTDKMSNVTVAAAMARLSRRGDDMRVTLLDEFAGKAGKDTGLLKRVITAYGDDSVQQLSGIHFVIEGASNWLTKKLEWGRLAAYLEQSTRYIYFDQKDEKGNYKYYTPKNLNAQTARSYEQTMNKVFDTYSQMVHKLSDYVRTNSDVPKKERDFAWKGATRAQACDAIRTVLPVSTKSTVGIYASGQALESLIMHLKAETMQEARDTGDKLLVEARKVVPVFLERADKPDRGGAFVAYNANTKASVKKIANKKLSPNMSPETKAVTLSEVWPKNELDLLPNMLYEHSSLPLNEIEKEVADWSYDDRLAAFKAYIGERLNRRHKPGRAMEQARYSWDLVCDYGIFRDLQRHRMVDDLNWQLLTPRYGYEIPDLVEEAGLSDLFEKCFDLSYKLYSEMQAAGYDEEAQYATLMGHRMRWKITYNARQAFHFHELRTAPQGHPGYRKLVKQMHDTLAEHHPLIAEAMKFVNKDEDPKLTRLAGERYTQYKLKQLDNEHRNG